MNTNIKTIHALQLIDCKCRPMIEVIVTTQDGITGCGCAPTGSSVGAYESFVLRDGDMAHYHGLSVLNAISNVNTILAPALTGIDVTDQKKIDQIMIDLDGTKDKHILGGNAIYSVSIACYRAAAACFQKPMYQYIANQSPKSLPVPSFNVINGGFYTHLTQPFNEFIIMPYGAKTISEAVEMGVLVFERLEKVLTDFLGGNKPGVAPSYGYIAPSDDPEIVLDLIAEAIDKCGYTGKFGYALDCASSEMYDKSSHTYLLKGKRISAQELIAYTKYLTEKYNFVFIEDLLDENAWEDYPLAVSEITRTNIIGDDFIVTNPERIRRAYEQHAIDGFILKPNQVGTISEALAAYQFARKHSILAIPSGRAGGVIGDIVMDLAVGLNVPFIKNGAPRSGERIDKLNYLLRIGDLYPDCILSDISSLLKFAKE